MSPVLSKNTDPVRSHVSALLFATIRFYRQISFRSDRDVCKQDRQLESMEKSRHDIDLDFTAPDRRNGIDLDPRVHILYTPIYIVRV